MAWQNITSDEIQTGKPVSSMSKVKNNLDDLNSRLSDVEQGSAITYAPVTFDYIGRYDYDAGTYVMQTVAGFDLEVTGVFLTIVENGVSGTTEVDVELSDDGISWASCLTTNPTVVYSAGDYATSSNGVVDTGNSQVIGGGYIRLKIETAQSEGKSFIVRVEFNKI